MASEWTPAAKVKVQNQTACDDVANSLSSPSCLSIHGSLYNLRLHDLDIGSREVSDYRR